MKIQIRVTIELENGDEYYEWYEVTDNNIKDKMKKISNVVVMADNKTKKFYSSENLLAMLDD